METVFEDWKRVLADFKKDVDKELSEIRRHKREVQKMRLQMETEYNTGKLISDPNRIILSAPEIIIGNVDHSGELKFDASCNVVIKGCSVRIEGVGAGGEVVTKAPTIIQKAVNPGSDSEEEVVENVSQIISQAKTVVIQANDEEDLFSSNAGATIGGVTIHADNSLILEASVEADSKKKRIDNSISTLEQIKDKAGNEADSSKKVFESLIKEMQDIIEKHDSLLQDEISARSDIGDVFVLNEKRRALTANLYTAFRLYSKSLSQLAEFTRQINALKKQKENIPSSDSYTKDPTGASMQIRAENINIVSSDGEGNLRDNPGSGVNITGNSINLSSIEWDGSLKPKGNIEIRAMDMALSTQDSKNVEFDDNYNLIKGEFESKGKIRVKSADIEMESLDYEVKDKKISEKALTKGGHLSMRFESFDLSTTDTEGKATGSVAINSKKIDLKSMDVDKEQRTDKSLAQGSAMLLLSEKIFIGGKDKDTESKLVQTASETIGTFAKTTYEVQQGDKKSVLQMDGGKMSISGDSTGIYGKTTVNGATEIKGELKAPKASIDNVEAKSSFKSPNISDGMGVGAGGGAGSLSAKLNKEEAPKEEKK